MLSVVWQKIYDHAFVFTVKEAELGWLLNATAFLQSHIVHYRIGYCMNDSYWAVVQSLADQEFTSVCQEAILLHLLIPNWPIA